MRKELVDMGEIIMMLHINAWHALHHWRDEEFKLLKFVACIIKASLVSTKQSLLPWVDAPHTQRLLQAL